MLLASGACSLRSEQPEVTLGSQISLTGQASLVCSQECSDRGQCGTSQQGVMVLLNSMAPATSGHDTAVLQGTLVNIDHNEARPVIQVSDQQFMTVVYYQVDVPGRGLVWTAGWCVAQ